MLNPNFSIICTNVTIILDWISTSIAQNLRRGLGHIETSNFGAKHAKYEYVQYYIMHVNSLRAHVTKCACIQLVVVEMSTTS